MGPPVLYVPVSGFIRWMDLAELLYVLQGSGLRSTTTTGANATNTTPEADLELEASQEGTIHR